MSNRGHNPQHNQGWISMYSRSGSRNMTNPEQSRVWDAEYVAYKQSPEYCMETIALSVRTVIAALRGYYDSIAVITGKNDARK
jgi:hypothetical protein